MKRFSSLLIPMTTIVLAASVAFCAVRNAFVVAEDSSLSPYSSSISTPPSSFDVAAYASDIYDADADTDGDVAADHNFVSSADSLAAAAADDDDDDNTEPSLAALVMQTSVSQQKKPKVRKWCQKLAACFRGKTGETSDDQSHTAKNVVKESKQAIAFRLADKDPFAIKVLTEVVSHPDGAHVIEQLQHHKIAGFDIWDLYQYDCNASIDRFVKLRFKQSGEAMPC